MIVEKNGLKYFVFENLTAAGVRHCFTTRVGGVSSGVYDSLNMGMSSGDCADAVRENYRLVCHAVGFDIGGIVRTRQVHGVAVEATGLVRGQSQKAGTVPCQLGSGTVPRSWGLSPGAAPAVEADGLMTDEVGVVLVTYYADCVPLLFFDVRLRVVANAHAGWRGVVQGMPASAVDAMKRQYGSNPADILVGIGPSISAENFEVGAEVVEEFKKSLPFSDKTVYNSKIAKNKFHIDLWQVCRESLILTGIKPENIEIAGICTHANADLFYSHRRDGTPRGNMAAFIGVT